MIELIAIFAFFAIAAIGAFIAASFDAWHELNKANNQSKQVD
jgi:uncharacterized membrane protein